MFNERHNKSFYSDIIASNYPACIPTYMMGLADINNYVFMLVFLGCSGMQEILHLT